ncbi:oligosaccharide flippase family protein [Blastochloris viridis]|uniref:Lipopolysaccharide biosynthesis protein wzxC n=1 Tax=Blastochloris viridis TaxID=1079 RepID=A0A182D183_BLAVI|nr:oligosaccharide flippase family protein [Blastochloris viridis]ALK10904.1 colanic acid exporter [Blastochloris viridis]BAR99118.1 hypothetical protein BV133_1525 [Blastochloris viridis]
MSAETKSGTGPGTRLIGWVGWAGLDALGRLVLLTGSTVVFSRYLAPSDFGITALVLTVVAVAAVFVGMPFEEALAQRRVLRKAALEAALAASWLVGLVLLALSIAGGWLLAEAYGEPDMRLLLPVAMLTIFFSGHSDIVTALARRHRRFNEVAIATLVGNLIGVATSILMVVLGFGLWSLIAQRVVIAAARAVVLQLRLGIVVVPRWSSSQLKSLGRFAGLTFFDRLVDNVTFLVFNNVVGAIYGVTVLGYVNMSMRFIEPIRGAIAATGHNLAFFFFASAQRDIAELKRRAETVVSQAALVSTPVFIGMAAVLPVLLPIVAGPGWDEAVDIAVCLALGSAIVIPARLIYTALSAIARPEYSVVANVAAFAATVAVLVGASGLGPISVGLSRIAGDATQVAVAIGLRPRHLVWSRTGRLMALLPAWLLAGAMGLAVWAAATALPALNAALTLALLVLLGVAIYLLLLAVFARPALRSLIALVRARRANPTEVRP